MSTTRESQTGRNGAGPDADLPPQHPVLTARQLCELPDPPAADQLLGPLVVPGQRLVIGAHTGHGKTTMAMQMLAAIAERREFLGWPGTGGPALVIDAEQGLRTIKRRLREARLDRSENVDYMRAPDGLELDCDERQIASIEDVIASGGYSAVFIDPLYKLHRGDSNAEREAVDLMRQLDAWRERYGFALILAAHCRKPPIGAKFTMHDLFGSSAYPRGAEVVLGLQRLGDGYCRLHWWKDRDGELPPVNSYWGLLFDRHDGFSRDPRDGQHRATGKDQIEELLRNSPGLTIAELMSATGKVEKTVRRALPDLGATSDKSNPAHWFLPGTDTEEPD